MACKQAPNFFSHLVPVPVPVREPEPAYALVAHGAAVPDAECELAGVEAVEVSVRWGMNVLFVTHLSPPRSFLLGESEADFVVPAARLGAARLPILVVEGGVPRVVLPPGARVTTRGLAPDACEESSILLRSGGHITVELGDLVIELAAVFAGKPVERALFGSADRAAGSYLGLSLLSHAAIIGALAFFTPPLGLTDDEGLDAQRLITMQQYLTASAEREREREPAPDAADALDKGSGERGEAAKGEAGKMGRPFAPPTRKRSGVEGPKDNPDPHLQRQQALRDAQNFGIIGMLTTASGDARALAVPWGRDTSLGTEPLSAVGDMWGTEIGESVGGGGLGISGIGEGGGGPGQGIGLDGVGTCGSAICSGLEGGIGSSVGRPPGTHAPRSPRIRSSAPITSGTLPPEVIQRIVRQNFGRFRMCYEDGLRKNPNLEGRIEARFVIGRDGAVANVRNGASDLPDSGVVSCVVGAYYGLSFPPPSEGIVTVSYPIFFSPGG